MKSLTDDATSAQFRLAGGLGSRCRNATSDLTLCANAACGLLGRCLEADAEPNDSGDRRDCQHGQLARSCDICAAAREIAELRAVLAECAPIVYAHAESLHMLDGFRPQRREFDDLAQRLRDLLASGTR